jgi:hypothetical protein
MFLPYQKLRRSLSSIPALHSSAIHAARTLEKIDFIVTEKAIQFMKETGAQPFYLHLDLLGQLPRWRKSNFLSAHIPVSQNLQ